MWYDKTELLSHHTLLNLLGGGRGTGKTFAFKEWAIRDGIKNDKQFVWVRRYKDEIRAMKEDFFKDVASKFPKVNFEIKGSSSKGKFFADGKQIGYYLALSTAIINKSADFSKVDKIIFDEFLIMGNTYKYLADEVIMFLELMDTIFRPVRFIDKTMIKPRGAYLIGNNTTIANPYFLYFNVKPFKQRFYVDKKRGLTVEMWHNKAFEEMKTNTPMGRLIQGTEYFDYNIKNEAMYDNDKFIKPKAKDSEFYCAVDYNNKTYGFWIDWRQGEMYVNYQYDPSSYSHYSLTKEDHSINTFLIKSSNNTQIKTVVFMFRSGNLYFENQQIKAQVFEMLSFFVR